MRIAVRVPSKFLHGPAGKTMLIKQNRIGADGEMIQNIDKRTSYLARLAPKSNCTSILFLFSDI